MCNQPATRLRPALLLEKRGQSNFSRRTLLQRLETVLYLRRPRKAAGFPRARASNPLRTQKISRKAAARASPGRESSRATPDIASPARSAPRAASVRRKLRRSLRRSRARAFANAPEAPRESCERLDLHGKHGRQVTHDRIPSVSVI